jgi:hypothetical protein
MKLGLTGHLVSVLFKYNMLPPVLEDKSAPAKLHAQIQGYRPYNEEALAS